MCHTGALHLVVCVVICDFFLMYYKHLIITHKAVTLWHVHPWAWECVVIPLPHDCHPHPHSGVSTPSPSLIAIYTHRYTMGLIPTKWNLQLCNRVTASSFCRRRLPCLMLRSKMAPDLRTATTFIEQGHVRVGPEVVKDPAFLVTRW